MIFFLHAKSLCQVGLNGIPVSHFVSSISPSSDGLKCPKHNDRTEMGPYLFINNASTFNAIRSKTKAIILPTTQLIE